MTKPANNLAAVLADNLQDGLLNLARRLEDLLGELRAGGTGIARDPALVWREGLPDELEMTVNEIPHLTAQLEFEIGLARRIPESVATVH